MQLTQALRHWGTTLFEQTLKAELEGLPISSLPLQNATTQGGIVAESAISASILSSKTGEKEITVRVGVFFTEIVAGCNCSDPPMEINGYCLLGVCIDKCSGDTRFTVLAD